MQKEETKKRDMLKTIITGAGGALLAVATLAILEVATGWASDNVERWSPTILKGAVMAFDRSDLDQDTCPAGWEPFKEGRGRFVVGAGDPAAAPGEFGSDENGAPLTNRALRQHGGTERHQLSLAELARHHHPVTGPEWGHSINGNGAPPRLDLDDGPPWSNMTGRLTTGEVGTNEPHNNLPPYISLFLCRKT